MQVDNVVIGERKPRLSESQLSKLAEHLEKLSQLPEAHPLVRNVYGDYEPVATVLRPATE